MRKLRSYMVLFEDTTTTLAEHLGISRQTLSGRMNGRSSFKSDEIVRISERYHLSSDEIVDIFF